MEFFNPAPETLDGLSKSQIAKRTKNFSIMESVQFDAGEDKIVTWMVSCAPTQMLQVYEGRIVVKNF